MKQLFERERKYLLAAGALAIQADRLFQIHQWYLPERESGTEFKFKIIREPGTDFIRIALVRKVRLQDLTRSSHELKALKSVIQVPFPPSERFERLLGLPYISKQRAQQGCVCEDRFVTACHAGLRLVEQESDCRGCRFCEASSSRRPAVDWTEVTNDQRYQNRALGVPFTRAHLQRFVRQFGRLTFGPEPRHAELLRAEPLNCGTSHTWLGMP